MESSHARITVAAVAVRDDRFLLIEETVRGKTMITQPSGHWEPGESLHDAAVRETLEESAFAFVPEAVGGLYFWRHPVRGYPVARVNFIGQASGPVPDAELDKGVERALWLTRDELMTHPTPLRNPMVIRTIDDYLAGKRYPLELLQHVEKDWRAREQPAA
ncbi:MAG: NUDIX domain-containing protein [Gammaproteobacteria bacterium]